MIKSNNKTFKYSYLNIKKPKIYSNETVFDYYGTKLRCKSLGDNLECTGCFFESEANYGRCTKSKQFACFESDRKDGSYAIFVEVENGI